MKMRKLTAFVIVAVALFATLFEAPVFNVRAEGEEETEPAKIADAKKDTDGDILFVQGHEYANKFIAGRFLDTDKLDASITCYFSYNHDGEGDDEEYCQTNSKVKDGKTTFRCKAGDYKIKFFYGTEKDGEITEEADPFETGFKVIDKKDAVNPPRYAENADYAAYMGKLKEYLKSKKADENFYFDLKDRKNFEDMFGSDYYDYDGLKKEIWYCRPSSKSFTKTTNSYFKLSEVGTYCFYVLANDAGGNALKVNTDKDAEDKAERRVYSDAEGNPVEGVEGWYVKDGGTEKLVAPIFSLYFADVKEPQITMDAKLNNGYKGLMYKSAKHAITVVASGATTEYFLYYSSSAFPDEGNKVDAVLEKAKDITENKEVAFDRNALTFTPFTAKNNPYHTDENQTDYYYIVCKVHDDQGNFEQAVTDAIKVSDPFREVKKDPEIWKNYKVSIIFLSIAVLSLIGIIILFFIKPKEKAEEEVKEVTKK